METLYYTFLKTPIGELLIASSDKNLVRIILPKEGASDLFSRLKKDFPRANLIRDAGKNQKACQELLEYFHGARTSFTVPLDLRGTEFQQSVWKAVARVPYGKTSSYGEIARKIGKPKACRAVGNANRANPIPIVIPCHRILGSDGSLTGFGGGIHLKEKLLNLENNS